eukprot:11176059-Lingulodinium_polyedra.AAC.1
MAGHAAAASEAAASCLGAQRCREGSMGQRLGVLAQHPAGWPVVERQWRAGLPRPGRQPRSQLGAAWATSCRIGCGA